MKRSPHRRGCKLASDWSDRRITRFSIHDVDFSLEFTYIRVLKIFWGAVFQARLVLRYVLAGDCIGMCALLHCKSVLVLVRLGFQWYWYVVVQSYSTFCAKTYKDEFGAAASGYHKFDVLECRRTRSHGLSTWLQKMVCIHNLND